MPAKRPENHRVWIWRGTLLLVFAVIGLGFLYWESVRNPDEFAASESRVPTESTKEGHLRTLDIPITPEGVEELVASNPARPTAARKSAHPDSSPSSGGRDQEFPAYVLRFVENELLTPENVAQYFGTDDLPALHALMKHEEQRSIWARVIFILAYIGDHGQSVPIVIDYFERADEWTYFEKDIMFGKAWALDVLGYLGGPEAEVFLRQALTVEGLKQSALNWLDGANSKEFGNSFTPKLIYHAAYGLVYTRKNENVRAVEELFYRILPEAQAFYAEINEGPDLEMDTMSEAELEILFERDDRLRLSYGLAEVLATTDLIAEIGMENYGPLLIDAMERWSQIDPYYDKYLEMIEGE